MNRKAIFALTIIGLVYLPFKINAQEEDLLKMVEGDKKPKSEPIAYTFKTTRIINAQSIETVKGKTMDFRIAHRFGNIGEASGGGIHTLYGLDAVADVRISFEFGLTDKLMVGVGRCKRGEFLDGIIKWRFLEQTTDGKIPLTLCLHHSTTFSPMATPIFYQGTKITENVVTDRFSYTNQLLIARKFSERFSMELIPGWTHRNFVKAYVNPDNGVEDENDIISIGVGGRIKLTKRFAIIADYFYVISKYRQNNTATPYYNPLAVGFEWETGGHVFHLTFTNASGLLDNDFIPNTNDTWTRGGFKFGFNISRVFNIR